MTDWQISGTRQWQVFDVPARIPSARKWFGLRRVPVQPDPLVDLREPVDESKYEIKYDAESVIGRLSRLRDAGLITNAEFDKERRALLSADTSRR